MAEFRDNNYWGSSRTPSTDAQLAKPRRSIEEILAASNRGEPPAEYEVQQAVKELQDYATQQQARTGSRRLDPTRAQQLNDLLYKVTPNAFKPQMYNNPADAFKPVSQPVVDASPASKQAPPTLDDLPGYGLINSVFGDGGIVDLYKNAQQQEDEKNNSPEAILRRLQEQSGQYAYSGPSAEEMAKKQFDPQFQLLKSIADQTTNRYNTNKADISKMYAGLVNDQTTSRGQDKAMYDAAVGKTGASYDAAAKGLTDNTAAYSKAMAAEMARLGIKEGAGTVVGNVRNNLTDNLGRLAQEGQSTKDLLSGLGASEYTYDTNQIGTAKQAGLNTQEDFLKNYMASMAGNDQQRLQLTGQQGQAENEYNMQIQKLLQQGQAQQQSSILNQFKSIMSGNQQQADNTYRQAGLDLDQHKFAYQQQHDADVLAAKNSSHASLNPYDALSKRALELYKGDTTKTRATVDEILSQYERNPGAKTVADFLNGIENKDALKANPEMTALIYDFISRVLAEQKK